ncbi:helical backbone metal receptor [Glaciecola petra]|uniref:Helical backbone metal receptor n=1 Tax=Glaciecola petra TaxID=3075602 RepID=A0ABU2ZTN4_9ALTE|nr:helical backbone metal receptor [Aestuariibacter sp. P117]MDT0596008.1 helical backbone metal receptor [Aestuariibacter sp. P117]
MNKTLVFFIFIISGGILPHASSYSVDTTQSYETNKRIIALSPHLTEIVYALEQQTYLVGVSDYSDFPPEASELPTVASYQGANIASIIRLQPSHILVWQGGNKDADIQRLREQGFNIYLSSIATPQDLVSDIRNIGAFLNSTKKANILANNLEAKLRALNDERKNLRSVVYYLNKVPMVGLGNDPWLNSLLNLCHLENIYHDKVQAYPQLNIADIIRRQPEIIIAANGSTYDLERSFWEAHSRVLKKTSVLMINPDAMHRFTPRAIDETIRLCNLVKQTNLND